MDLCRDEWCGEPRCIENAKWWVLLGDKVMFLLAFCDAHKDKCGEYGADKAQLCDRDKIEKLLIVKQI